MALNFSFSSLLSSPTTLSAKLTPQRSSMKLAKPNTIVYAGSQPTDQLVVRRSANYKANVWDYNKLMSLTSKYTEDVYKIKAGELKENVREILNDSIGTIASLDLIDAIQRLGLGHHYKAEIKRALNDLVINLDQWLDNDLYTTSLGFRLLRQHGYHVSQDVLRKCIQENGSFKNCVSGDVKGMLSLYEACYFGLEGEDFMDEAIAFTAKYLNDAKGSINGILAKKVDHSLELPLHWRTSRLESRWYIDVYKDEENMVPILLDLAKLDYNILQTTHQSEVEILTRWWMDLGVDKMDFSRNRILEHYFWSLGMISEQQFGAFRIGLTQVTTIITLIDDIYDVYGTLEELVLFTNAVERWDVSAMEKLPQYMKICYMALLNTNNQISFEILKEQGFDITSNQKKALVDLCKAFLVEAKWFYTGYTPSLAEYLENAVVSISTPVILIFCYLLTTKKITKEALNCIESMPSLVYNSAMVFRLANDLKTSKGEIARGDVPKVIQCYMNEVGVSEEDARNYVKNLIYVTWKNMNVALRARYPFGEPLVSAAANLGRQAQCMYQYGDGHGIPDQETKVRLKSLVIDPIPLEKHNYGML